MDVRPYERERSRECYPYGRLPQQGEVVEYAGAQAVLLTPVFSDGWVRLAEEMGSLADSTYSGTSQLVSISSPYLQWQGKATALDASEA